MSENQARQCADDRVTLPTATGARDWRARSAKTELSRVEGDGYIDVKGERL